MKGAHEWMSSGNIETTEIAFSQMDLKGQLAVVNDAIYAILVGSQSYTIGSRKITRADLSQLYKMRQDLEAQAIADENQSGLFDDCYVAVWPYER